MVKKIRELYSDNQFVAALSVILMVSPYPIINCWLINKTGIICTLLYFIFILFLMLCHGSVLVTKLFPKYSYVFRKTEHTTD